MTEEKSYAQMRREFQDKFQNELSPFLRKYEERRKKLLSTNKIMYFVAVAVAVLLWFVGGPIIGFIIYVVANHKRKEFETEIKKRVMPVICSCLGDIKWQNAVDYYREMFEEKIWTGAVGDYMHVSETGLLGYFSLVKYDDMFSGNFKNVDFQIVESHYVVQSSKRTRTVFKGIIVKVDMNKNFTGNTVVRANNAYAKQDIPKGLKRTILEDVQFEKQYYVYTNDEVEARYLLTPAFMERLNNVKTAFNGKVLCAFYRNALYIGIEHSKDAFALCDLNRPMDDAYQYYKLYDEISSIYKMIDHLKLDQKIGL